jgi:glycosyltransferase involved in cell wall biosynthesis
MRPIVWLLSAYRSDSHAVWSDWLQATISSVDWQVRELPGRHFAWRIRGNPLSWLDSLPAQRPDLILATAMVDLATLKGLHPRLAPVPCWYYFHENQFAYPQSDRQLSTIEAGMVQIYGALAANRILFNSEWNRQSFFEGVDELLDKLPDARPQQLAERLAGRSEILPVPVQAIAPAAQRRPRLIVWNHRWEYDKAPEAFASAMLDLAARGADFELALLGKRGPRSHPALETLRQKLADRIIADGHLGRGEYQRLLGQAGIAISTARHEFQGLSLLEAASAGVCPLVPDALCYPEQYRPPYRYPAGNVQALVTRLIEWLSEGLPAPPDVSPWLSGPVGRRWQAAIDSQLGSADQSGGSSIS